MKKVFNLITLLSTLTLASCQSFNINNLPNNTVDLNQVVGEISDFNLLSPQDNLQTSVVPTFTWEKANNATHYTFELASTQQFDSKDQVYIKKTGLTDTTYSLTSSLKYKEQMYYYRVTAVNNDHVKFCNQKFSSFYLKSNNEEEIPFDIEYADEWTVHELGSKANVKIDNSNFFSNNKKSLVVGFKGEDTNKGDPESDGWIVVTHNQEEEMYGVDAFYFNFYYSGQSSSIWIRCVDEDNEYYNAEIKVANNVKQTIIMKFDDFTLRTKGGTTIANQVFDYHHIKCVELVFEQTFGDGICLISDLKAVNYSKYAYMFKDKLNFNDDVDKEKITTDNEEAFSYSFSDDGNGTTICYNSKMNGYGFVRYPIEKFLVTSDAIKLKLEYSGDLASKILIRIIEEDKDRWVYRQECKFIPDNHELIIPYKAFSLSEYNGNGSREFYYLKQLQIGVENAYSAGTIKISNIEFVNLNDEIENLYQVEIDQNGLIDNFNSYTNSAQLYYKWQVGTNNKDEAMILNKDMSFGSNNSCVKLGYKSDMSPAYYGLQFTNSIKNKNGISLALNDASIKYEDAKFNHINSVSAKAVVSLIVSSGEEYTYIIDAVNKYWSRYNISFTDFTLTTTKTEDTIALTSENIIGFRIGLQYYYYLSNGISYPVYSNNNYVYLDDVKLVNIDQTSIESMARKVIPSNNENISYIDDFESYHTNDDLQNYWIDAKPQTYSGLELSNDTYNNLGKSMKLKYKGNAESVSYNYQTLIDDSVQAKGVSLNVKGDDKAKMYINLFITYAGNNYKYRATINTLSSSWNKYSVGFTNFVKIEGTGSVTLSNKIVKNITQISFGLVNSVDSNNSACYIDDIALDFSIGYDANLIIAL